MGSTGSVAAVVLAVDGGNVKTDLALVDASGELLAFVRGPRSSPQSIGLERTVSLLESMRAQALAHAGLDGAALPAVAQIMIAGADLPEEFEALRTAISPRGWATSLVVDNDTFALLRAGTDRGWGVAVVCGGGINCVGIGRDGRRTAFPALGPITGDWGGGYDIGMAALSAAARGADGRGPRTVLESVVPRHFGLDTPLDVGRAIHLGELRHERIGELPPAVFGAAGEDRVAAGIVARLADEVVALASTALRRLELSEAEPEVVLGGGVLRTASAALLERIARGIHETAPGAELVVVRGAPVLGAVLLGLDAVGAGVGAAARARAVLLGAVQPIPAEADEAAETLRRSHG
jgi:N-acetylglucosamine kinase-like BadF-type ATPase